MCLFGKYDAIVRLTQPLQASDVLTRILIILIIRIILMIRKFGMCTQVLDNSSVGIV